MAGPISKRPPSKNGIGMELTKTKFKRTEVGLIPEEWAIEFLESLTEKIGSGITPKGGSAVYKPTGRPFVRSQNIGWGNLILKDIAFIDEETHQTFLNTEIKNDDTFLNISGASIGRSSIASAMLVGGNVNQHVCIIRTLHDKLDSRYLNKVLLSKIGQKQIDAFQSGGNREGLNIGQIRSFQIPLPPTLTEQKAIATALSDVDEMIAKLEKLIEKKKAIKQGAMQQLLTPPHKGGKRLEGFSGEWVERRLGDIGKTFGGLSGKTKRDFENGDMPFITFLNVLTNVKIKSEFAYVRISPNEVQNIVKCGDLLFNTSSETPEEVGMCAVLLDVIPNLYLNSFCFGYRLIENSQCDGLFISYLINSDIGRSLFQSLAQGATRYNLSKSNFNNIKLTVPHLEQQKFIARILADLDSEIERFDLKKLKLTQLKQGMMQELLTGRTRLV